jgi:Adenylate and Guanylate cyclase catalytic domain
VSQPLAALEIAHVLSMDIAGGFSLPMDEQTRMLRRLQRIVGKTKEFTRAQKADQVISLLKGDGMELVFFSNPVAPVQCAFEIARALKDRPEIKLRMGVHSGPVYRIADINTNTSVAGEGINTAHKVMECGDASHILLSHTVADTLRQLGSWAGSVHGCGECELKPGEPIHLFNLYTSELGNSALPEKLRSNNLAPVQASAPVAAKAIALTEVVAKRSKLPLFIILGALIVGGAITAYFTLFKSAPQRPLSQAVFHEEFPNLDRWAKPASGSGWAITNGRLELKDQQEIIWAPDVYVEDFAMQFHLKLINDGGAAWALRVQEDVKNYYLFYLSGPGGLSPNRFITYLVRNGIRNQIGAVAIVPHLEAGGEYRIEIAVRKNEFIHKIRVNNMAGEFAPDEIGRVFNLAWEKEPTNAFARGSIGFLTINQERFQVDDLDVWPPETKPLEPELPQ